jgi:SulP family sulfate permease
MVVSVTFLLVVFRDLTEGIIVGFALAGLVFIRRMSEVGIEGRSPDRPAEDARPDRVIYTLRGPYFFGAAAQIGGVLEQIAEAPRAFVLDMTEVPMIDSSGARSFHQLAMRARRRGGQLYLVGLRETLRRQLQAQGLREPDVLYLADMAAVDALLNQDESG